MSDLSVLLGETDLAANNAKKKKSNLPLILGASVGGGILLLALVAGVALFLYSRRTKSSLLFNASADSL